MVQKQNNENTNHNNENEVQRTKKFVFQIYDDNIDFIENVSQTKKNVLINKIIQNYRLEKYKDTQNEEFKNIIKKVIITALIIFIGIPLGFKLINLSFDLTMNSYSEMQNNFQKLF